uniref:calpain-3-like n=1 Tax=Oncorhynchus gorbuscha TaxID=8017 RepID=UPI001EAE88D4|nr:calpain-3-like [Oncorhynchus gorbuscha]
MYILHIIFMYWICMCPGWFCLNPQFHLTLLEEDNDPSDLELTCSFLVTLMQKHQRLRGVHLGIGLDTHIPAHERMLRVCLPVLSGPELAPPTHQHLEVVIRGRLAPGHYVIIPSTPETNQQGELILWVLTEK